MVLGFLIATLVFFSLSVLINIASIDKSPSKIGNALAIIVYLIFITFNIISITQVV